MGCAPCYKPLPLVLRMTGTDGTQDFVQDTDIRKWLPGSHSVSLRAALPRHMVPGEYSLELGLLCPHTDVVYLATNAPRSGGFYRLGTITVTE